MDFKNIETPQIKDYDEITAVWEASVRATHHFLSEEDILFYKPLILNEYLHRVKLFSIKNKNNEIIAFIGISGKKIAMLFVHPDYRGKGVGKLLVEFVIQEYLVNSVDVNEQNEQAVKFYNHLGFKVVNRQPIDGMGKPFPILEMEL